MSTPINDGGPAFPGEEGESGYGNCKRVLLPDGGYSWILINQGMSLRACIAKDVLAGMVASGKDWDGSSETAIALTQPGRFAMAAVAFADALILQLERK